MRVLYLTIDNVNDNVILAQTFPFLGRLARLEGVQGVWLFALRKGAGEQYRSYLPADVRTTVAANHGIWHPLTLLHLVSFAWRAWWTTQPGDLVVGRNPVSLLLLWPASRLRGAALVLDYRGILSEEYALQGRVAARGLVHRLLRRLEGWALVRADFILCVSDRLRIRARRFRPSAAARLSVVPCCYDPRLRTMSGGRDESLRATLGLALDDFVLLYAGSLSAWNVPQLLLEVFETFRAAEPRVRLLLLTEDRDAAERFSGYSGVHVRAVPHEEIPRYLALGDVGLLVRRSHAVNRIASPVKLAEYLLCGLPVLVSPGIGDVPGIVRRERVGFVLGERQSPAEIVQNVRANRAGYAARCRQVAEQLFDRERYLSVYRAMLEIASRGALTPGSDRAEDPGRRAEAGGAARRADSACSKS